ncbi:MAG: hypothetical protein ACE5PO_07605 [Candidatus Bathyarchaeia archaeon]
MVHATRIRRGVGYQIRIKPRELALLVKSLSLLLEANRRNPAILGLFRRDAANVILSLHARLAMAVMRLPKGGIKGGPSPRVRLNALNITVSRVALEQLEQELSMRPDLLSPLNPEKAADLAERLRMRLGAYLMRYEASEGD